MTIGARQKNRIVRCDTLSRSRRVGNIGGFQNVSIQPRPVTQWPGGVARTALFHFREKIFEGGSFLPGSDSSLSRRCRKCDSAHRSSPARRFAPCRSIRRLPRQVKFRGVFIRADKDDAAAFYRDCFRMGLPVVHGVDVAVDENGSPVRRLVPARHSKR